MRLHCTSCYIMLTGSKTSESWVELYRIAFILLLDVWCLISLPTLQIHKTLLGCKICLLTYLCGSLWALPLIWFQGYHFVMQISCMQPTEKNCFLRRTSYLKQILHSYKECSGKWIWCAKGSAKWQLEPDRPLAAPSGSPALFHRLWTVSSWTGNLVPSHPDRKSVV